MSDRLVPFVHPWPEDLLGNVAAVTVGGTPSTAVQDFWDGDVPWMASGDVHLKRIVDVPQRISELGLRHSNATLVDPPSVAIALAGQGRTRGTAALVVTKLCTNQSVALITAAQADLSVDYVFLNLDFRYEELRSRSAGGGRAGLTKRIIEQLPMPLPPGAEQETIAHALSAADRAIGETSALLAKQLRISSGLLHDLLTRGVNEHGEIRSEMTHQFKDSPIGRVPREWTVQTLGDVLREAGGFLQTGPFGSQLHAHEYVPEGVPVVMPQDISRGRVATAQIARIPEARATDLCRHRLQPNDVVFSRRGDLLRAAAISLREQGWICGTGCFLLRAPAESLECRWLADAYRHSRTQRQVETNAAGSTMPSLNNAVMSQLMIAFPPVGEQREVARRREAADATLNAIVREKEKLISIKTGLMQDLLTGRRRVTPLLNAEVAQEQVS